MAFSVESICRACMENFSGNSMPLINKKKRRKTTICQNYEELTSLKVSEADQLPLQLCLGCVSELNKCFAFKDKCVRTVKTLRTYLDISDDEEKEADESSDELPLVVRNRRPKRSSKVATQQEFAEYEFVEETTDGKGQATEVVLEGYKNLLNPTSSNSLENDSLVFIIENVSDNPENTNLIAANAGEVVDSSSIEIKDKYECEKCKMEFVRKKNFENHLLKYHNDDPDTADEEPMSKRLRLNLSRTKDQENLKTELEENPEAKKCKTCGALYVNEKSLRLHERRNACKQTSYECDVCKKIFTDQKLFTDHTNAHPQQQEEETATLKAMETAQNNDPDRKYPCDLCPKAFKMLSTLKDHRRIHTGDKPFVCTICNRGFSQNTNLKQHLRRHTQVKPYKCNVKDCDASFVSKGELDSHSRKHSGDHPFACEQCDSKFTTSSSLVKHRRIHSGEKPYQCEFCPMRFTALGTLNNHTRTHTGERPHACQFCERRFTQRSDLAAHERTHTGQRPYKCRICKSSFHQSGTLKSHMKIHKNNADIEEGNEIENESD